jgi:hypothetical protein
LRRALGTLSSYAGKATCDEDPSGIDAITAENKALAPAFDATTCARQSSDTQVRKRGLVAYDQIRATSRQLTLVGAHMSARQALFDAQQALTNAQKSKNVDDAKAAAKVAAASAKAARDALAIAADVCTRNTVTTVEQIAGQAQEQADLRDSAPNSMCGPDSNGLPQKMCGIYGVSAAALSYLWTLNGSTGSGGRRLASVGVPAGALRITLTNWAAVDIGGYSAFITKSLASAVPNVSKISCSKNPTDYENRLPCEASNEMYAYFGVYGGITVGRKGVGFVTLTPITFGIAQLGTRTTLVPYVGLSVGVLQLNGSF